MSIKEKILSSFKEEFSFIYDKFEIMDLLENKSKMDSEVISYLELPSKEYNIVFHPGVYFFIGNNELYRVGKSIQNSRARVIQHLDNWTEKEGFCVWDIDKYDDKSILIINVKNQRDIHWLLSIEAFFEINFKPKIRAGRIG